MKALLLSAGYGKRLRPLTLSRPKALVPIVNIPILERNIQFLKKSGIKEIVINTHYLSTQIEEFLESKRFDIPIHTVFEPEILGTGGAIKNTKLFFKKEPFLVMNVDILTTIDIKKAYEWHKIQKSDVTLVLHKYPCFKKVILADELKVKAILKEETKKEEAFSFTGIHIINPSIIDEMPSFPFDIISFYRDLLKEEANIKIKGYIAYGHYWRDIGSIGSYIKANKELLGKRRFVIDSSSFVHPSAHLSNWAIIGKGCVIKENAVISGSILWDNVKVEKNAHLIDKVVTDGVTVYNEIPVKFPT